VGRDGETETVDSENVKIMSGPNYAGERGVAGPSGLTTDEKLDQILKALDRIEARQLQGLQKIEEAAPPEVGNFASSS
jgi:hypothetical protein